MFRTDDLTGFEARTQLGGFSAATQSRSDQDSSSSSWPSPSSGRMHIEEAAEVRTTRRTVPALAHDLITFRVPRTDGSIWSLCRMHAENATREARARVGQ